MTPFTLDQWVLVLLVFLLGLLLGMFLFAGGRWKRRYRNEVLRREEAEREWQRSEKDWRERDRLRDAAVRHPVDKERGPL